MEHGKDCMCHLCLPGELRLPGDEPTPGPSQDFVVSAQSNEGNKLVPERLDRGSEIRSPIQSGTKSEIGRDYTRAVYQNLMAVVELLDKKAPLPVSQKQIQEELELSKGVVYDICWNLCKRDWAEEIGNGMIRIKSKTTQTEAALGRKIANIIGELYGITLEKPDKPNPFELPVF